MSKIYRRETLPPVGVTKEKVKTRKRNVILNFRTTPDERALIEKRIELSGLPKQDFFIASCLHQPINVIGNVKTFDAIRKEMKLIDEHLRNIEVPEDLELEKLESLRAILEILDSFYRDES